MTLDILLGGGLGAVALLTLIQIAPVKVDPWSAIAKALGRAINGELLQHQKHTREDFIEILGVIDSYEDYCKNHPDYKNSRCVHAVANIERVYDQLLVTGDFLAEVPQP